MGFSQSENSLSPQRNYFGGTIIRRSRCIFESNDLDVMLRRIDNGLGAKQILSNEPNTATFQSQIESGLSHNNYAFVIPLTVDVDQDLQIIQNLREQFPHIILDTDANGVFLPGENIAWNDLIQFYQALDQYHIRMHEEPIMICQGELSPIFQLQNQINTPISLNQCFTNRQKLAEILTQAKI